LYPFFNRRSGALLLAKSMAWEDTRAIVAFCATRLPQPRCECENTDMPEPKYQITVSPRATYIPEQSDAEAERYAFAYTITITNTGEVPAQLISRHWIITDAHNLEQEVKGQGVVGAQPKLKPGESFEYTSGSILATPVGTMRGAYQMVAEDGTHFDAPIPEFTLSAPRVLH
jgi:ApaG protein